MIAIFDSGYGGLTVLKPIMELLPQYDYLYLGDNARAPYGIHSQETILEFSKQAVDYLFDRGAVLIIFACNTASAAALSKIQKQYIVEKKVAGKNILGVLIPVAEKAAEVSKKKRIGVVGTKATISSEAYINEIQKIDKNIRVISKACPLLVPLIEEDWHTKPEAISILKKYLRPLKDHNIDTLILGCTHYPFMLNDFKRIMGKKINILTSGEITANSLKDYLERHPEIESKLTRNKTKKYLTTDCPNEFSKFVEKNLGMKISQPEKVSLTTPTQ